MATVLSRRFSYPVLAICARSQRTAASAQVPAPEVYMTIPPQPKEKKPGQLERWQVEQYFDKGFLVVPNFFTEDELKPVIEGVKECVEILADKLYKGGKIKDKCEKAGFYERLTLIEHQYKGSTVLLHKMNYLPQAFRDLWANFRLLNVVEQLIGPNIAGHPVWNLRTKTPHNEQTTVPWHQDNAYLDQDALYTLQPTAWIPLLDANLENGCMQMIPEGHKIGRTLTHTCCAGDTWYVDLAESEIEKAYNIDVKRDAVTCEVPFGGLVFLNNCIPHRSLENYSNKIRWSLDLRWQDPSKPAGFYGINDAVKEGDPDNNNDWVGMLKDVVLMRKEGDPDYKVNWEEYVAVHRDKVQEEDVATDDFDTTIHGPWMTRWEITHPNRHTASMKLDGSSHKA